MLGKVGVSLGLVALNLAGAAVITVVGFPIWVLDKAFDITCP